MSIDSGDVEMIVNAKIQQLIAAVEKALPYEGGRIAEEFKKQQYYKAMETANVVQSAFDPIVDPNAEIKSTLTREDVMFDYSYTQDDKRFNFNTDCYVPGAEELQLALEQKPYLFCFDESEEIDMSDEGMQKFCNEIDKHIEETEKLLNIDADIEELDRKRAEWNKNYELAMSNLKG